MNEINYDDDNLEQIGDDQFAVITDDNDTLVLESHLDTIIDGQHVVIDTFKKNDTLIIEKTTWDRELKIIEKLIDTPDFGKSLVSILIMVFVAMSIFRKWNCKKTDKDG